MPFCYRRLLVKILLYHQSIVDFLSYFFIVLLHLFSKLLLLFLNILNLLGYILCL